eukprot:152656-Rhodomonas_salina.2
MLSTKQEQAKKGKLYQCLQPPKHCRYVSKASDCFSDQPCSMQGRVGELPLTESNPVGAYPVGGHKPYNVLIRPAYPGYAGIASTVAGPNSKKQSDSPSVRQSSMVPGSLPFTATSNE